MLATGDLSETGSAESYARLAPVLAGIGAPVHCLPGNHDRPEVLRRALQGPNIHHRAAIEAGAWRIVLLDTTVPGEDGGRLSDESLRRLDAARGAQRARPALIALHHPPVAIGSPWMDELGLANPEAFFAVVDRHPQVRAVIFGHIHQPFESVRKGGLILGAPATSRQFRPRRADTEMSDEPPACRWLRLHADGRIESELIWAN